MAVTEILARGWAFSCNGTTVGPDGIKSFKISHTKKDADTSTYGSNGREEHIPVTRGTTLTLEGLFLEDEDTGARDAGQAAFDALAEAVGTAGLGTIVVTSPGGNTYTFTASAKKADIGGGNDDVTSWGVEVTVSGAVMEG
ncbi:MAG: hypothetical protein PHO41_07270 [Eubacteriales bacterium]|nr:hypothetical protein [Eubacteriales bacterium]